MGLTGAAAARLYDDHVDVVHALLTRRVGADSSPELVDQTFEQAIRASDDLAAGGGDERTFVVAAALAVLRKHGDAERRHLRSLTRRHDRSGAPIADPLFDDSQRRGAPPSNPPHPGEPSPSGTESTVMTAVADLTPDERDIVLLSLWEGFSHRAIADTLDIPVGSVRSALGRIRRDLKFTAGSDAR